MLTERPLFSFDNPNLNNSFICLPSTISPPLFYPIYNFHQPHFKPSPLISYFLLLTHSFNLLIDFSRLVLLPLLSRLYISFVYLICFLLIATSPISYFSFLSVLFFCVVCLMCMRCISRMFSSYNYLSHFLLLVSFCFVLLYCMSYVYALYISYVFFL